MSRVNKVHQTENENFLKNKKRVKLDLNNLEELRYPKKHLLEFLKSIKKNKRIIFF